MVTVPPPAGSLLQDLLPARVGRSGRTKDWPYRAERVSTGQGCRPEDEKAAEAIRSSAFEQLRDTTLREVVRDVGWNGIGEPPLTVLRGGGPENTRTAASPASFFSSWRRTW